MSILNFDIFCDKLSAISVKGELIINTINQYSYCIAQKDDEFKKALKNSDILLPDGVGITAIARLFYNKKIEKIAGADIHDDLLKKLNKASGSCFYMGSSQQTLDKIKLRVRREYPNIRAGFYSPPFKKEFSTNDNEQILEAVNIFRPDVLFVGMTAPKQEKWATTFKDQLQANVICSIGAVFDFYAGTVQRPGLFWQKLGLEWFGRLVKEPRRMFKRYIYYGFVYLGYLLKFRFQKTNTNIG